VTIGPVLVDLPLTPGAVQAFAIEIEPGAYDEIEFDIHKPDDDDPEDLTFLQQHPDFLDVSIRVEGTFNGQSFTFETDLNVEQELDFAPPLMIEDMGSTNVTIQVGLDSWFVTAGGVIINPQTGNKGEPNESLVTENIKVSIEAFEDEDRDGS
jgi:hypothetical protein